MKLKNVIFAVYIASTFALLGLSYADSWARHDRYQRANDNISMERDRLSNIHNAMRELCQLENAIRSDKCIVNGTNCAVVAARLSALMNSLVSISQKNRANTDPLPCEVIMKIVLRTLFVIMVVAFAGYLGVIFGEEILRGYRGNN